MYIYIYKERENESVCVCGRLPRPYTNRTVFNYFILRFFSLSLSFLTNCFIYFFCFKNKFQQKYRKIEGKQEKKKYIYK